MVSCVLVKLPMEVLFCQAASFQWGICLPTAKALAALSQVLLYLMVEGVPWPGLSLARLESSSPFR
jgi:hypothetical protein